MSDAVDGATAAFERWHEAFNARDSAGQVAEMQFPHVRLTALNQFMRWETAEEFQASQDELTARLRAEDWDHTENLSIEVVQEGAEKVHFALRESRVKGDGTEYNGFDTLWIFTKIDGRWGLQFRSSFLAGSAQGV
jgi:hypothetical protein